MNSQRYLALAGLGSRRKCAQLISEGRVAVNGQILTFGRQIQPGDEVRVDGARIMPPPALVYLALNKPAGAISDHGAPGAPSALDLVDFPERLFSVGRLDKDATGLLLLTNDGELAQRLTHPRYEHEKEYRVLVAGQPSAETLARWRRGVDLNGEQTAPAQVTADSPEGGGTWLRVVLREGRKRQIKRVAKLLGHPVLRLIRVRIGPITLGALKPGQWRRLSDDETRALRDAAGLARVVAIDGPASSGKSTVASALAARLGYLYLDTGVMYRAVTLAALRRGIPPQDETAVTALARQVRIEVTAPRLDDGRAYTVGLDGDDVTWAIRAPEVEAAVSIVSAYSGVRAEMVDQQRRIAQQTAVIMVGRDIGTVVLPDADLKIYLDATVEERARRRHAEMLARGESASYEAVLASLRKRDELDSTRAHSPLRAAPDAVTIDSTHRQPGEIVDMLCTMMEEGRHRRGRDENPQGRDHSGRPPAAHAAVANPGRP
jgi:cytidylate kinase